MKNLYTIGIKEFKKTFSLHDNFQDKVMVVDLNFDNKREITDIDIRTVSTRLKGLTFFLVQKGLTKIKIDYYPYTLSVDNLLILMPGHTLQINDVSSDFQANLLLLDMDFVHDNRPDNSRFSIASLMEMRKNPVIELTQEENKHLKPYFDSIKEKIRLRTHFLQNDVIKNRIAAFLLELVNIMMGKRENIKPATLTRREEIVNNFLSLLTEHCKEEHDVSFYAEKLCITPQYLSLVLKDLMGNTANVIIDQAIISEAKILIRTNEYAMKQIADILHFSDQSSFGKFFRKQTGISPTEYKRRLTNI